LKKGTFARLRVGRLPENSIAGLQGELVNSGHRKMFERMGF